MIINRSLALVVIIAAAVALSGCGGGGGAGSGGGALPSKTLSWEPPTAYTDDTPLDPVTDLDRFEIYVKEGGSFTDQDSPAAAVAALDPSTNDVCKTFNLNNLAPFLNQGVVYHVALRAVGNTGSKSEFSPSATFSF